MDLRKELAALNPLQAEWEKLEAAKLSTAMPWTTTFENEARMAAEASYRSAGSILHEQEMGRLEKLQKDISGTERIMAEAKLGYTPLAHIKGVMPNSVFPTGHSLAQSMAEDEQARIKKLIGPIPEFKLRDAIAESLNTLGRSHIHGNTPLPDEYMASQNRARSEAARKHQVEQKREEEKLKLAKITADAMLAALAAAERREAEAKVEATASKAELKAAKGREWINICFAGTALVIAILALALPYWLKP